MKKLILFATLVMAAFVGNAQFRYAAVAGYDNTNLRFNQDLITIKPVSGFKAGVKGELMFPGIGFGIDIAGIYALKGATLHFGEKEIWASEGYGTRRSYLHYLEIPLNLKFKWTRMNGVEDYIAPFVYGGPTMSFLLGHNHLPPLKYAGGVLGLQVGGGVEIYKKWQIEVCYNWGMTYTLKTKKLDNYTARDRMFSVSLLRYF